MMREPTVLVAMLTLAMYRLPVGLACPSAPTVVRVGTYPDPAEKAGGLDPAAGMPTVFHKLCQVPAPSAVADAL